MTVSLGYALLGAAVLALSIYPLVLARDLLRRIVAANAFGTGIFVILVALGYRGEGAPPDPTPSRLGADRHRRRGERHRACIGPGGTDACRRCKA
ncbi:hypothetical protein [Phenylobacterium sp. J367]|uniref:hypothetical protein n=1 Tax=Phenylobacterium sp. J367 TaxID=2898435 RepID=UPI002151F607|nr:hypothetical protein [Phenylobacterium sp. J367]MCR5881282.1 hypothetical protein [Phenylobacterium sp. J367]